MGVGTAVLNFLTGGVLQRVLDYFIARDAAKLASLNEAERMAFDERRDIRQASKEIRLATAGFWEMRVMTFLIAFPFVVHVNLVGLDTNFLSGTLRVPKFPAPFDEWEGAILLSFFGVAAGVGLGKAAIGAVIARGRQRGLTANAKPP